VPFNGKPSCAASGNTSARHAKAAIKPKVLFRILFPPKIITFSNAGALYPILPLPVSSLL
jgi:hypothetical protein